MCLIILFWWCESTPLNEIIWFVVIMISLKTRLLQAPFSAWYFWMFAPNMSTFCLNACFDFTALFAVVISLNICKSIKKNDQQILWQGDILYSFAFFWELGLFCLGDIQFDWLKCTLPVNHVHLQYPLLNHLSYDIYNFVFQKTC